MERKACSKSSSSSGVAKPRKIPIPITVVTPGGSCKMHEIPPEGSDNVVVATTLVTTTSVVTM